MAKRFTFLILWGLLLLPAASTSGQGICGDVNGDSTINVVDFVYLVNWLNQGGPPPPDTTTANVDQCPGADVGDLAYLIQNVFYGGPEPCSSAANCTPFAGGIITLDSVSGELSPGVLGTGTPITFYLRVTNNTGDTILHMSNGFRVYSTDGAQWSTTTADTTGALNLDQFSLGIWTYTYSGTGAGADTVGILAANYLMNGMPSGYDDVAFTITIGPISSADVGKTICLDSSFYGPGGTWKWQVDGFNHYAPAWGGPYCFTILEPTLEVDPDTLNVSVYAGSQYPVAGSFHVSEASGYNIPFQCINDTDSFTSLSKISGTTPDDIIVWANGYGMSPGNYQTTIQVDAGAGNAPLDVVVNMTVYDDPEAAVILDNVSGGYGTTGVKTGVPVTFTMRAINNSGDYITGVENGHRVYSPDGISWDTLTFDSVPAFADLFDLGFFIVEVNTDGTGSDTVGYGAVVLANDGMPDGYDNLAYSITVGPIDSAYDGQTICLDSTFFPPAGLWLWSTQIGQIVPEWSGPHCFTVHYVPFSLVAYPDTLRFEAVEGGANPAAQSIFVEEAGGADIAYFISDSVDAPFFVDKYSGNTPDSVVVTVDATGLPAGTYVETVIFDATEANNTPLTVYLELEVTELQIGDDSLVIPSVMVDQVCGAVQPVAVQLSQPIKGASIPIEIPEGVAVLDLSFDGLLTETWDYTVTEINSASGYAFVALANSQGLTIPAGTTTVFNMTFNAGTAECQVGSYMRWDTTLTDDPARALLFADTNNLDLLPGFYYFRDSTQVPGYVPGDFDGDQTRNIADLTALVDFLFRYGPPPCVLEAIDLNGSCTGPNIADLTYFVDFLFQSGPQPVCGCIGVAKAAPALHPEISVSAEHNNGITTIALNSPIDLRGLQLELQGTGDAAPVSLLEKRLDLVYGENGGNLKVGLLDLEGEATIASGTQRIIKLSGEYEITEAIVSDRGHHDLMASIGASTESTLPTEYALQQNYPNPFNPSTEISFSLPQAGPVKLDIFNVMGQHVETLVDGHRDAGVYTVIWDGSGVASGIYLYRLQAGQFVETRKMMLLK